MGIRDFLLGGTDARQMLSEAYQQASSKPIRAAAPSAASKKSVTKPIAQAEAPAWRVSPVRLGAETTNMEAVSRIIRWADGGFFGPIVDLFDEFRLKDAHLHAVLMTLELSLSGMELRISPATDKKSDRRVALWVQEALDEFGVTFRRDIAPSDMTDMVNHHVGGFVYGYSVSQTIWDRSGGEIIPIGGIPIQPRRFICDPEDSRLKLYDAAGGIQWPGVDLYSKYQSQICQFQPRVNGTGVMSEGMLRVLIWAALFRNWGIRDWLQVAKLAWHPYILGGIKRGESGGSIGKVGGNPAIFHDVAHLEQAMQDIVQYGTAVIPDTTEIKVEWAKKSGGESDHEALCRFFGEEISKVVLGSTLPTQQGRNGARALGEVQDGLRIDRRNSMGRAIAGMWRKDLVEPLVRMNRGVGVAIPRVALVPRNDIDPKTFGETLKLLKDIGMQYPASWVRGQLSVPAPKPGEEVIGPPILDRVPVLPPDEQIAKAKQKLKRVAAIRARFAEYEETEQELERERLAEEDAMAAITASRKARRQRYGEE